MHNTALTIQRKRYIKFAKIEKPTAWVVAAFVVEQEGDTIVHVSEPRIIKVIAKQIAALTGKVAKFATKLLAAPQIIQQKGGQYTFTYPTALFGSQTAILNWFGARPPTFAM